MIQLNLESDSNRKLKKLRNKKTKWIKSPLSIFNCLDSDIKIEEYRPEKVLTVQEQKVKKFLRKFKPVVPRAQRRLNHLLKLISEGKELKDKEVRRYVLCCRKLGTNPPDEIVKRYASYQEQRAILHKNKINAFHQRQKAKNEQKKPKKNPRSYKTYMESNLWVQRKNQLFKERPRQCEICGVFRYIQVHHLRYDKNLFGKEPSSDLAILCSKHHKAFHAEYGVSKDCHKDFEIYKAKEIAVL